MTGGRNEDLRIPTLSMTPAQAAATADGVIREVQATRAPRLWGQSLGLLARALAKEQAAKAAANRAINRESAAAAILAGVPRVVRVLPAWLSAIITVLLMGASLVTLSTVLAVADVPPVEAWLLPAAFGPVFVLITKVLVSWLLNVTDDKPQTRRRLARLLVPALLIGFAAVGVGIALKSMVIGSSAPLADSDAMLSSAAMFGAVVLAEGIGAAALAAHQHAPGAREFEAARWEHRCAQQSADRKVKKAFNAQGARTQREARLAGRQEWAAGRGAMARAYARYKAVTIASPGDAILETVTVDAIHVPAPVVGLLQVREPVTALGGRRLVGTAEPIDIDTEFRRLLAERHRVDGQDPLW